MLKFRIFGSSVRSTGSVPSADSQSGVAFVGRQLAKALSSELKSIRSNFLALFGFGRLSPPSEIEEHVLRLTEEEKTELTANSDLAGKGGAAVASELRQLMAQMKELDKHNQVLQDAQNNRAQMSALLNEVRECLKKSLMA